MTGRRRRTRPLRAAAPSARSLALPVAAGAAAEAAALALPVTAIWLLARAAEHPSIAALSVAIVGVRAFALARGGLRYGERLAGHDAALRALTRLRTGLYEALVPLAPAGLPAFRRADLLRRMVGDGDAVQDLVVRVLMPAVSACVVGAGAVVLCATLVPLAGIVLGAGLALVLVAVPVAAARGHRRTARGLASAHAGVAVAAVDVVDGAAELAAFGAGDRALDDASRASRALAGLERRDAVATAVAVAVPLLVQGLTTAAVALVALEAYASGGLTGPTLAVVAIAALAAFEPAMAMPDAARTLVDVRTAARRLGACFDAEAPVRDPAVPLPAPRRPVTVRVRDLRVRYPGRDTDAVEGVDLDLTPGGRVALVGPSGLGKSTVLAVLQRFIAPAGGTVLLNDAPIDAYAADDVRAVITGVTQDAHVFHVDLASNLRLAKPDATDAELRAVLGRVRLDRWLDALPAGLATELDGGTRMSGGQRQRLLLARALLADPAVLLLDEPTEGVDDETADSLLADLLTAAGDTTVLLVSHRDAGLGEVDAVVELPDRTPTLCGGDVAEPHSQRHIPASCLR